MSKSQATEFANFLLHKTELAQLDEREKKTMCQLIRASAHEFGISDFKRLDQIDNARKLLGTKLDRPAICERLMGAYRISRATAYRLIAEADRLSQMLPDFETRKASN